MKQTIITLKNGKVREGILWIWRPTEGYLELASEDSTQDPRIFLKDIESAVEKRVMVSRSRIEDVDLLERAKKEGWKYGTASI